MNLVLFSLLATSSSYLSLSGLTPSFPPKMALSGLSSRQKRGFHHPMAFVREARLPSFHPDLRGSNFRGKRKGAEEVNQLRDCMTVSSNQEGVWEFRSDGSPETCGLYLVTNPDMLIELEILENDIDCQSGLVVLFDGWELNGKVFPGPEDHQLALDQRSLPLCAGRRHEVLLSSQNAALVSFKVPVPGQGFKLRVRYRPNPQPCNILMSEMVGLFTLENRGQARNCSLTTLLFPANFELRKVTVGGGVGRHRRSHTSGLTGTNCFPDFVELGGSSELDSSHLTTSQTLCGEQNKPGKALTVLCGSSTVRLVSSGSYHNSVVVLVKAATDEDLNYDNNLVMTCPEFLGTP